MSDEINSLKSKSWKQPSKYILWNRCSWTVGTISGEFPFLLILKPESLQLHCKHCMKSVQIRSFFWSAFSPNAWKYGPEKAPYLDTFHAVKETRILIRVLLNFYNFLRNFRTHLFYRVFYIARNQNKNTRQIFIKSKL